MSTDDREQGIDFGQRRFQLLKIVGGDPDVGRHAIALVRGDTFNLEFDVEC